MEKIVLLMSPDPENFLLVLQKVWYDLSFLLVVYEWLVSRFLLVSEILVIIHCRKKLQQLSQNLGNAVHVLAQKEKRQFIPQYIQQRMILAADNFF